MNGDTDSSCLIRNGSCDSLSYPPSSVGRKLKALCIVEFFNSLDKTEVALLNQIEELHTSADISLCNADNKTKVSLCKSLLCTGVVVRNSHSKIDFLLGCKKRNTAYFFKINLYRIVNSSDSRINCFGSLLSLRKRNVKISRVKFKVKVVDNLNVESLKIFINLFKLLHIEIAFNHSGIDFLSCNLTCDFTLFDKLGYRILLLCCVLHNFSFTFTHHY